MINDQEIREILNYKTIAVVGCSPKEARASHAVASYLKTVGYQVVPINPSCQTILDEKCYPNLLQVPEKIEIVNVFRRPEEVFPIVRDAVRIGAKALWLQDGIEHPSAEKFAREHGLKVVSNNCIMREHQRLNGPFRKTIPTC